MITSVKGSQEIEILLVPPGDNGRKDLSSRMQVRFFPSSLVKLGDRNQVRIQNGGDLCGAPVAFPFWAWMKIVL